MGKQSQSLADVVAGEVATATKRRTWWDHLPQDGRDELLKVRQRFRDGQYATAAALTIARILKAECEPRGWRLGDIKRVSEWLRAND